MNKYIKSTLIFSGIWFVASFLNGLLSAICIVVFDNAANANMGTVTLSFVFSYFFSVPAVGLTWFITLIAQANNKKGNELLQFVLGTACIIAIAASIFFILTMGTEFMKARFAVAFSIVFSALAAVLIFRKQIKTNE